MIEGLRGKRAGRSSADGGTEGAERTPTDRDRFYIKVPDSSGTYGKSPGLRSAGQRSRPGAPQRASREFWYMPQRPVL